MYTKLIHERLAALRKRMKEENVNLYLVTSNDFHMSTTPAPFFGALNYISGFSGSEGNMLITSENAHLWTTEMNLPRAKRELDGTGIILHTYNDYTDEIRTLPMFFGASGAAFFDAMLGDGSGDPMQSVDELKTVIGCDGRTVPFNLISEIIENLGIAFDTGAVSLDVKMDLIGDIWKDRPPLSCEKIWLLEEKYSGESSAEKLEQVRELLAEYGPDTAIILTALDDICWLYNIRGNDTPNDLTTLSYSYVSDENAFLFIDSSKVTGKVREQLEMNGVTLKSYDEFYTFLEKTPNHLIIVDPTRNNAAVVVTVGESEAAMTNHVGIIGDMKAIKNETEQRNAFDVHLTDAVVMVTFIKWLKENVGKVNITETSAAKYLDLLRSSAGAICPSLPTVCAYGKHSAICNYRQEDGADYSVLPKGLLVIDSGAHYQGGTTEITRTIPLGPLSPEMIRDYTISVCGMLELQNAVFPFGLLDSQVDVFARKPLWKYGLDFEHGTGHGIGNMLEANEGPQAIAWKRGRRGIMLCDGMITSNEPGIYREGEYGVRNSNEMLCRMSEEMPGFLRFMYITFVPIDTSAIDTSLMSFEQVDMLNSYNIAVRRLLEPMLDEEHRIWLAGQTEPLIKTAGIGL